MPKTKKTTRKNTHSHTQEHRNHVFGVAMTCSLSRSLFSLLKLKQCMRLTDAAKKAHVVLYNVSIPMTHIVEARP